MSIFIDSANPGEVKKALNLGWVTGITTNPLLLARENIKVTDLLKNLGSLAVGQVFYQLVSKTFAEMIDEADQALEILEGKLVVKLPPTDLGFKVCSQLSTRIPCCPTAIYAPAQALIASEAGAQYIAVYVNRATRLMEDGISLTKNISEVLTDSRTEVLAASLKSPEEAVNAIKAGARHLTLPFTTLMAMSGHELSEAATLQFDKEGRGLPEA